MIEGLLALVREGLRSFLVTESLRAGLTLLFLRYFSGSGTFISSFSEEVDSKEVMELLLEE